MRVDRQKQIERIVTSAIVAILVHALIFLVIEYGKLLVFEDYAGYIGPLAIGFEELVPTPDAVSEEDQAVEDQPVASADEDVVVEKTEEPFEEEEVSELEEAPTVEEPVEEIVKTVVAKVEAPVAPPEEKAPEPAPDPASAPKPAGKPIAQGAPKQTAKPIPEQRPQTEQPATTTPFVEKKEHLFVGKDNISEYSVEMANKSQKAKPAFRIPIDLPAWVAEEKKKLMVVFEFILGPDGQITYLSKQKSSGYDDLDAAVARSLMPADGNGWQFSVPSGDERAMGTFTFRTNE